MGKKKITTGGVLASTSELAGDGANPRRISDESATGLRNSLKRFGDLSGIVFNTRTGELVTGHQRMAQIRAEYGEREIEPIDAAAGLYGIRVDEEHYFPVRVVDWSPARQRAANVAANNPKIQGSFTGDLSTYLLSVEAELAAELPGVLDDCLLVELMAAGLDTADASEEEEEEDIEVTDHSAVATMRFQIIVQCSGEQQQVELLERFAKEGLKCRALIT